MKNRRNFIKQIIAVAALAPLAYWGKISMSGKTVYPASDHYDPAKKIFFNARPIPPMKDIPVGKWYDLFFNNQVGPQSPLPSLKPDWGDFFAPHAEAKFIWFGHSCLMARLGGQTLIFDPVFGDHVSPLPIVMKRFQPPPAALNELPPVDAVVITHNHYDHLEKSSIRFFAKQNSRFIVPLGLAATLQDWGVPAERIQELDWWQSAENGGVKITAVPARHNSGRGFFDGNASLWCGHVFEYQGRRFYNSGDGAFDSHFAAVKQRFGDFDIAFIENGQYSDYWFTHMRPEETVQAAQIIAAQRFMPIHWGMYPLSFHKWNESVRQSVPLAREKSLKPLTPILGEVFDKHTASRDWWGRE